MQSMRYLNGVLTILVVLLTLNLWTLWTTTPAGEVMSMAQPAEAQGIANAAAQRKEMIEQLTQINSKMTDLNAILTSQSVRVIVEAMPSE